jgi:hypothetical protein
MITRRPHACAATRRARPVQDREAPRRQPGRLKDKLSDWLKSDHDNLAASLARFVGSPAYGPGTLHDDIARFRFLLGATDGEGLFTLDEP